MASSWSAAVEEEYHKLRRAGAPVHQGADALLSVDGAAPQQQHLLPQQQEVTAAAAPSCRKRPLAEALDGAHNPHVGLSAGAGSTAVPAMTRLEAVLKAQLDSLDERAQHEAQTLRLAPSLHEAHVSTSSSSQSSGSSSNSSAVVPVVQRVIETPSASSSVSAPGALPPAVAPPPASTVSVPFPPFASPYAAVPMHLPAEPYPRPPALAASLTAYAQQLSPQSTATAAATSAATAAAAAIGIHAEPSSSGCGLMQYAEYEYSGGMLDGVAGSGEVADLEDGHGRMTRKAWSIEEDTAILDSVYQFGQRWRVIAALLPGRSDDAVRNRWNRLQEQIKEGELIGSVGGSARWHHDDGGEVGGVGVGVGVGSGSGSGASGGFAPPLLRNLPGYNGDLGGGLSRKEGYKCSKCGQPKRNHQCTNPDLPVASKRGPVRPKPAAADEEGGGIVGMAGDDRVRVSWSREEDMTIRSCVRRVGPRWSLIAAELRGRTDHAVRNRWHRLQSMDEDEALGGVGGGGGAAGGGEEQRPTTALAPQAVAVPRG